MADSLSTLYDNQIAVNFTTHVPFKAYLRIIPSEDGKRWMALREKQRTVKKIQDELIAAGWTISTPFGMLPGFGIVTVVGFYSVAASTSPSVAPVTEAKIIHPGTGEGTKTSVMSGHTGVPSILTDGRNATSAVDAAVVTMRNALLADSATLTASATIEQIEFNGLLYGRHGRHLP